MLAEQTAMAQSRPPTLSRTLSRLLSPRARQTYAPVLLGSSDAAATELRTAAMGPLDLVLADLAEETVLQAAEPSRAAPISPQILLGGLAPRRSAFGQRSDPVLDLLEPAAPEPRRLMLMAADGASVGEIIIHANDGPVVPLRRPFAAPEMETPYFPEDLADEPRAMRVLEHAPQTLPEVCKPKRPARLPKVEAPARSELAATFLLADLAARLASEAATLQDRLRQVAA